MKLQHWATLFFIAMGIGCQAPPAAPAYPPAATSEQIQQIRESFKEKDSTAQVGIVLDVLSSENLAAVGDVDLSNVKNGEVVCFIDSTTAPLICGEIVRVTDSQVHVKFETPDKGHRAPVRGDLAVIFR